MAALAVSRMTTKYGGKTNHFMRPADITEGCFNSNPVVKPEMWSQTDGSGNVTWTLAEPMPLEGITVKHHDLLVKVGQPHSSLFGTTDDTPPPFYELDAP